MRPETLIGIRHVYAGSRKIPVLLMRTHAGGVAGQCLLENAERPIVDGASVQDVLQVIEGALDALLLSRANLSPAYASASRPTPSDG